MFGSNPNSRQARWLLLALVLTAAWAVAEPNTLVPSGRTVYAAGPLPDRIILLPGADAAREAAVGWRTEAGAFDTMAQIAVAGDGPGFADKAVEVAGEQRLLVTDNGRALHHRVRLARLQPDTLYAYRVRGHGTWSEWLQFRTPPEQFQPFDVIYLGDAQNRIRSQVSRVIRQAWLAAPQARLVVHTGDQVNGRAGNHDDEWAEWFAAGSPFFAMTPNVVAAGNHEYLKYADGRDAYERLMPHWPAQFPTPANGASVVPDTTYFVDLMGVRFVVLDSTSALDLDSIQAQAKWLDTVLSGHDQRWTVVVYHHPLVSPSHGRDNPALREHWLPVMARRGVDLVLQGHDHTYGRGVLGAAADEGGHRLVYAVSVTGPKQYLTSDQTRARMQRIAEDTQLYQVIRFEADRLRYRAHTATGALYDSFDLARQADGGNRLVETGERDRIDERRCLEPENQRCRN